MTQALCIQIFFPSGSSCGARPGAPNTPTFTSKGTRNCITETPRLPSPAFKAKALPFSLRGKKKLILAMEEAKLAPPRPQSKANTTNIKYGVLGSRSEEHTSELQSRGHLVCRLLLEQKKTRK